MLFNSFAFLFVFLPLCLTGYFAFGRFAARWPAMFWLLAASLGFYSYWNPWHTLVLIGSIGTNYGLGRLLIATRSRPVLFLGVGANLALLGLYKYLGFLSSIGQDLGLGTPAVQIILPIGISFYTFVQIAYLIDARNGRVNDMNFSRYGLFVSFFPHSLAGPMVHHTDLMPQFRKPDATRWQWDNVAQGIGFLCLGLGKKVIVADSFAVWANAVFDSTAALAPLEAWAGALSYTFQLYFDFSGYSDMAIGLGLFFNIRFPDNFNAPYRAASISDFWRRWHMTLSRWLREYLYIPLGGNRCSTPRMYLNLFLTMLIGGIWHGAGWTYVAWGALHGCLLIINRLHNSYARPLPGWASRPLTFVAIVVGWVFFRASSMERAVDILWSAVNLGSWRHESLQALPGGLVTLAAIVAALFTVNLAPTTKELVGNHTGKTGFAYLLATIFLVCLWQMRDVALNLTKSQFIYFQF